MARDVFEEPKRSQSSDATGYLLATLVMGPFLIMVEGFVAYKLWRWYAVPLLPETVPVPHWAAFAAALLFANLFVTIRATNESVHAERLFLSTAAGFVRALATLATTR